MLKNAIKLLCYLACTLFIVTIVACRTTGGGVHVGWIPDSKMRHPPCSKKAAKRGPPPHAPAHGYRAKYKYHYYPHAQVYFDISREVYFYMEGNAWRMSACLPGGLHVRLGDYVAIDMDSDKPYKHFKKHKKKYPPGHRKKNKQELQKEKIKASEEMAREHRKHHEEMEREHRKHREEMARESYKHYEEMNR